MSDARAEHAGPPVPRRPRPDRHGPDRRSFLRMAAMLSAGAPLTLSSCKILRQNGSELTGSLLLATPEHPVRWPLPPDNQRIRNSLTPERGATLRLYNYADYIDPNAIKSFVKKYKRYDVKVVVSTFNDTDEAITKIRGGRVPFDIYFPSYDQIGRLVTERLIHPLNHTYLSNIDNVWPSFQNPWYDLGWQYSVPYTTYTTGVAWRTDKVTTDIATLKNPYDALWDPAYRGETAIIDDWHTAMGMCLLRHGIDDVNTASAKDLAVIGRELADIAAKTAPRVTITMYNDLPAGQLGQCQMWSGDVVNAQYYLPKHTPVDVLRYWFPADGRGMVDNDLMVVLRSGRNPVLAHLFIQHMLEKEVAIGNFGAIGYQPPQRSLTPQEVIKQEIVPKNLATAVVKEEYFNVGYRLLELSPANDAAWHKIWLAFKAGS